MTTQDDYGHPVGPDRNRTVPSSGRLIWIAGWRWRPLPPVMRVSQRLRPPEHDPSNSSDLQHRKYLIEHEDRMPSGRIIFSASNWGRSGQAGAGQSCGFGLVRCAPLAKIGQYRVLSGLTN